VITYNQQQRNTKQTTINIKEDKNMTNLTVNYFDSRTGADSPVELIDYEVSDIQEWLENFAEDYWNTCEESETPGYHDEIYIKNEDNEIVASIKYNTRL
jgi:hypothetical protein